MTSDRALAIILWNYNQLHHNITSADFIFVMCSYNLTVADRAYELYQQNMGDFIVISGGIAHQNDLLATGWDRPEALIFKNRLLDLGVQKDKLLIEDKAMNCGENIQFTKSLLGVRPEKVKSGIIVHKPYMERRAYATASKQWPEVNWCVTSPDIAYEQYIDQSEESRLINILVGDTWRMVDYAEKGFQTPQEMPNEVEKSLQELINRGYTKHITN